MAIHDNAGDHGRGLAALLNASYFAQTLSYEALRRTLGVDPAAAELYAAIAEARPHLLAKTPYFLSRRQSERIAEIVRAVESVIALPVYRDRALAWAPSIARHDPGALGVFFSYDFHLQDAEPQLIEINTNAGGALLNTLLVRAQRSRGDRGRTSVFDDASEANEADEAEQGFVEMFRAEWRRQHARVPLKRIAIVDVDPDEQYLSPEFRLFERLLRRSGIASIIADPSELRFQDGRLQYRGQEIDLVYNRLTDFALAQPSNAALRDAYLDGRVVVTPHPRAHALYADKRNLTLLTDDSLLSSWGVDASTRALLSACIPRTEIVTAANCEAMWAQRQQWFFKPSAGYGGKAAYRGDKITRRVWRDILEGQYVAQRFVPPGRRRLAKAGDSLKADLRAYVYDGHVQLLAARLYNGQTTNFRTIGGGFATVLIVDDARSCALRYTAADARGRSFGYPFMLNSLGGSAVPH